MKHRLITTLILLLFVLVFTLQNAETVSLRLLFWSFEMPRAVLMLLILLIGMVIGWFSRTMYRLARAARQEFE